MIDTYTLKSIYLIIFVFVSSCVFAQGADTILQTKAQNGDVEAQYLLAKAYYNGDGVSQDTQKSFYWLIKAAEQGYAKAQDNLASAYYENGDKQKAFYWFNKAAEQGLALSQYSLAFMYYKADGVPSDAKRPYIGIRRLQIKI
ncbi:tetratricopeptide repeat protein [Neisseria sp. Ec49-e6-T10]|uniref:tetratricopeptide repeat protein n=1 Tax=Neisseria sp. Ec49-e6-T10 TaxID=3140744 RepID=UPI003EBB2DB3